MNEPTNYGGKKDLYMVKKGNGYKRFEDVVLLDGKGMFVISQTTNHFVSKLSFNIMCKTSHHNKIYHFCHMVMIIKLLFLHLLLMMIRSLTLMLHSNSN